MRLLRILREHPHAHSVFPFGDAVHYTDTRDDRDGPEISVELHRHLAEHGFADPEVTVIEPGIEDVFMALMQRAPRAAA